MRPSHGGGAGDGPPPELLAALPKGIAATLRHLGAQVARTARQQSQQGQRDRSDESYTYANTAAGSEDGRGSYDSTDVHGVPTDAERSYPTHSPPPNAVGPSNSFSIDPHSYSSSSSLFSATARPSAAEALEALLSGGWRRFGRGEGAADDGALHAHEVYGKGPSSFSTFPSSSAAAAFSEADEGAELYRRFRGAASPRGGPSSTDVAGADGGEEEAPTQQRYIHLHSSQVGPREYKTAPKMETRGSLKGGRGSGVATSTRVARGLRTAQPIGALPTQPFIPTAVAIPLDTALHQLETAEARGRALIAEWAFRTLCGSFSSQCSSSSPPMISDSFPSKHLLHLHSHSGSINSGEHFRQGFSALPNATLSEAFPTPSIFGQHRQALRLSAYLASAAAHCSAQERSAHDASVAAAAALQRQRDDAAAERAAFEEAAARREAAAAAERLALAQSASDAKKALRTAERRAQREAVAAEARRLALLSEFQSALAELERQHSVHVVPSIPASLSVSAADAQKHGEAAPAMSATAIGSHDVSAACGENSQLRTNQAQSDAHTISKSQNQSGICSHSQGQNQSEAIKGEEEAQHHSHQQLHVSQQQLRTMTRAIEQLRADVAARDAALSHANGLCASRKASAESLRESCARYEERCEALTARNRALTERVTALEISLDAAERRARRLGGGAAAAGGGSDERENEKERARQKERDEKEERAARRDTEALAREVGRLRGQLAFLKQQQKSQKKGEEKGSAADTKEKNPPTQDDPKPLPSAASQLRRVREDGGEGDRTASVVAAKRRAVGSSSVANGPSVGGAIGSAEGSGERRATKSSRGSHHDRSFVIAAAAALSGAVAPTACPSAVPAAHLAPSAPAGIPIADGGVSESDAEAGGGSLSSSASSDTLSFLLSSP